MGREKNRYIGLFDKPILRDWAAWYVAAWVPIWVLILVSPPEGSAQQTVGSAIFGLLASPVTFGLPVVLIRRFVRSRRQANQAAGAAGGQPPDSANSHQQELGAGGSVQMRSDAQHPLTHQTDRSRGSDQPTVVVSMPLGGLPRGAPAPLPRQRHMDRDIRRDAVESNSRSAMSERQDWPPPTSIGPSRHLAEGWEERARDLPFPIARSARALGSTTDPMEQYPRLLDCAETTTVVAGVVATVWLIEQGPVSKKIRDLLDRYRRTGVTFGTWIPLIDQLIEVARSKPSDAFAQTLSSALRDSQFTEHARSLLEERNRSAHGGQPRNKGDAALRLADMEPHLAAMLAALEPLSQFELLLVEGSRYSRRTEQFVVRAARMMGDHPDFRAVDLRVGSPLANETIYMSTPNGFLDLTPFLVYRFCPTCLQPEVLYADRTFSGSREVSLRAFASGHQTRDSGLYEDFQMIASPAVDESS